MEKIKVHKTQQDALVLIVASYTIKQHIEAIQKLVKESPEHFPDTKLVCENLDENFEKEAKELLKRCMDYE